MAHYKENTNKNNFIPQKNTKKKKKFTKSQLIVFILMIFWSICSILGSIGFAFSVAKAEEIDYSSYSYNLLPYPYSSGDSKISLGVTYSVNSDGSITISGSSTGYSSYTFFSAFDFVDGTTYYFGGSSVTGLSVIFAYRDSLGSIKYPSSSVVWDDSYSFIGLYVQVNGSGYTFDNVVIYPYFSTFQLSSWTPPIELVFDTGFDSGFTDGLTNSAYGVYTDVKINLSLTYSDNSTLTLLNQTPDMTYGGFSLNSFYDRYYYKSGSNSITVSSFSLDVFFSAPLNFSVTPVYYSGITDTVLAYFFGDGGWWPVYAQSSTSSSLYQFVLDIPDPNSYIVIIDRIEFFPIEDGSALQSFSLFSSNNGYSDGFSNGLSEGFDNGYRDGVRDTLNSDSYINAINNAKEEGRRIGYNEGVEDANEYTFLGLMGAVVDAPLNAVINMFDFDILGFNMKSFYLALITASLIVVIVKRLI